MGRSEAGEGARPEAEDSSGQGKQLGSPLGTVGVLNAKWRGLAGARLEPLANQDRVAIQVMLVVSLN